MSMNSAATVRMFGALHTARKQHGQPSKVEISIPAAGCTARELAQRLELPMDQVEAVFVNRRAYNLQKMVNPGDRVAFVPKGIPTIEAVLVGLHPIPRHS